MSALSDEDRESVCICPELLSVNVGAEEAFIIGACDRHAAAVESIVARHVAQALTEAADAISQAEPSWHRGMYGCPDDMFTRRSLANLVRVVRARIPN